MTRLAARYFVLFGLVLACAGTTQASTNQLREWILANKNALPASAQEALASASESDLASTILRMFGFGSDKQKETGETTLIVSTPTTTPRNGVPVSQRDVCPFNADPLILSGEYAYCKPANGGDCPLGFVCDQSFVLGRSICCQDLRQRPGARITGGSSGSNVVISIAVPGQPQPHQPHQPHQPLPLAPAPELTATTHKKPVWNSVTPSRTTPRWTSSPPATTRRAPWYIKDRTSWNTPYNGRATADNTVASTIITSTVPPTTTTVTTTTTATTPAASSPVTTSRPVNPWARLWTTTNAPQNNVNVSVLQSGSIRTLHDGQLEMVGAISLVNDNGLRVLVDTGSSSDTERLLQSLSKEHITLDEIDTVVITHGHPGHMGNMNFFGQKPILFHSMEYIGRHVTPTELKERPYRKLSKNIEVWKTPGHTQHDLSVLVHNVPSYGSMAIVGDLIPSEQFISENIDLMASESVWDSAIKRQNANLIICMADWVVPGHGQPFRVLPQYRQKAGCTRLLAQRHILNARA